MNFIISISICFLIGLGLRAAETFECHICYESYEGEYINGTQCGKNLCKACQTRLVKAECPFCKAELPGHCAGSATKEQQALIPQRLPIEKKPFEKQAVVDDQIVKANRELLLREPGFKKCTSSERDFRGAALNSVELSRADLYKAKLQFANLSHSFIKNSSNLDWADLSHAKAQSTVFVSAQLYQANLSKAQCQHSKFISSNLFESNLQGADLSHVHMLHVDMTKASLKAATFYGAKLENVNLIYADIDQVDFRNADLRTAYIGFCEGEIKIPIMKEYLQAHGAIFNEYTLFETEITEDAYQWLDLTQKIS